MFSSIWHSFFFDPVYNALVFFIDALPGGDVGLAIICTTLVVKLLLLPLSIKAVKTQSVMREIEPRLKEIRDTIEDKQEQAHAMLALYKESGINPFANILLLFIQIPIIIALYLSVYKGGGIPLPEINTDLLYAFIPEPTTITTLFLGFLDVTERSLPLAILAGVTQYIQARFSMPAPAPKDPNAPANFKDDLARNMHFQMRYGLPLIITFFAYTISASIALYFVTSNLIGLAQELYVRRYR